jgi:hypothetical protein
MDEAPDSGADALVTEWLDDMVKKLKAELDKALGRITTGTRSNSDAAALAADARTLASLERTLERLAQLEQSRAAVRESKIRKQDKGARDALERRLDKLAGAGLPKKPS